MRFYALALAAVVAGLGAPGAPGDDADGVVAPLLAEYQRLAKGHDAAARGARRRVVARLAETPGDTSLRHLRRIAADDPAILVRVAALEGLCLRGGPEDLADVVRALREEAPRYGWTALWVGRALGRATHPEAGRWVASEIPRHGTGDLAVALIRAAGSLRSGDAVGPLLALLRKTGGRRNPRVAFEVLRALGRIGGPTPLARLVLASREDDVESRMAAAESPLSASPDPTHAEAVRRLFADPDRWVRRAVARGVGVHRAAAFRDLLVTQLSDRSRAAAHAARQALAAIDGVDRGPRPEAWGAQGAYAGTAPPDERRARLPVDRVLFMLDMSISMGWPALERVPRLPTAKALVIDHLHRLEETSCFNVREFASASTYWRKPSKRGPAEVPATRENVEEAAAWVEGLTTHMHTNFGELVKALDEHPTIDTVYLVTDGRIQFDADDVTERILVRLESANLLRRVPIHVTFLMWGPSPRPDWELTPEDQRPLLEAIARESGGTYTEHLEPPR